MRANPGGLVVSIVGAGARRVGGFPGNPGGLVVSRPPGGGHRLTKPEAVDAAPGVRRSEAAGAQMVPPGEGNEARGDGRRGVGVSHITAAVSSERRKCRGD